MKKSIGVVTILLSTVFLSGCAIFDNEARDKAACDKLSTILSASGDSDLADGASTDLISAIENEVLPMASGKLGREIRSFLDSYENLESQSIFDQLAGSSDTLFYAGQVLDYCLALSSTRS